MQDWVNNQRQHDMQLFICTFHNLVIIRFLFHNYRTSYIVLFHSSRINFIQMTSDYNFLKYFEHTFNFFNYTKSLFLMLLKKISHLRIKLMTGQVTWIMDTSNIQKCQLFLILSRFQYKRNLTSRKCQRCPRPKIKALNSRHACQQFL